MQTIDDIFTPLIDSALHGVTDPTASAFFDQTQFEGWEPSAAWDDFKLYLKHGNEFEKIATLSNKRWQEVSAKVGSWMMTGAVRYFIHADTALCWLVYWSTIEAGRNDDNGYRRQRP